MPIIPINNNDNIISRLTSEQQAQYRLLSSDQQAKYLEQLKVYYQQMKDYQQQVNNQQYQQHSQTSQVQQQSQSQYFQNKSNETGKTMHQLVNEVQYTSKTSGTKVLGTIEKVDYKTKSCKIKIQTGEVFDCGYSHLSYLNIQQNDKIFFYLSMGSTGYIIEKYPYVQLGTDETSLIGCVMFGRGKRTTKAYALGFLNHINTIRIERKDEELNPKRADRLKDTHTFLSDCSILYKTRKLGKDMINKLTNDGNMMKKDEFTKLLYWWYNTRVMRQLYLFGMNNREINNEDIDMDPIDIYDTILTNPFLVLALTVDKCINICNILEKTYTNKDEIMGKIARSIQNNLVNRSWVGTPYWFLKVLVTEIAKERGDHKKTDGTMKYDQDIAKEYFSEYVKPMIKIYGMTPENNYVYMPLAHKIENYICDMVIEKTKNNPTNTIEPIYSKTDLDEDQKKAIKMALNSDLSIITGGAGTGKTTVIKQIYENNDRLGLNTATVSFTGQAVSVLKKVLSNDSPSTMHMMIHKSETKDPFDHLIIDEISMVYEKLFYDFIITFGHNYKITFVGDSNQLPAGKWGNLFTELLKIHTIPIGRLMTNHRSDVKGENGILINSKGVLRYYMEKKDSAPDEFVEPFRLTPTKNFKVVAGGNVDTIMKFVKSFASAGVKASNIMILYPHNREHDGVLDEINRKAQAIFNIQKDHVVDKKGYKWMIGDCVIMTKNNYNIGVMNGDRGVITDLIKATDIMKANNAKLEALNKNMRTNVGLPDTNNTEGIYDKILVKFRSGKEADFLVTYDDTYDKGKSSIENDNDDDNSTRKKLGTVSVLSHSYGMTIHKSQGSEAEFVFLLFPKPKEREGKFKNMHLLYTSMTRARVAMFCICESSASDLEDACMRSPGVRYDTLAYKIGKKLNS